MIMMQVLSFFRSIMVSVPICSALQATMTVILILAGLIVLFLMYNKSVPSPKCHPPPALAGRLAKQANLHNTSVVREQTALQR